MNSEREIVKKLFESSSTINEANYFWQFKGLQKTKDPAPGKSLPTGYVTDGLGNVYKVPTTGFSNSVSKYGFTFRYNYKTKELECLTGQSIVDTIKLNSSEWFDGPDYWIDKFYNDVIKNIKL